MSRNLSVDAYCDRINTWHRGLGYYFVFEFASGRDGWISDYPLALGWDKNDAIVIKNPGM